MHLDMKENCYKYQIKSSSIYSHYAQQVPIKYSLYIDWGNINCDMFSDVLHIETGFNMEKTDFFLAIKFMH